jgi:hypothetical protein
MSLSSLVDISPTDERKPGVTASPKQQWARLVTDDAQARVQELQRMMNNIELQQRVALRKLDSLMNGSNEIADGTSDTSTSLETSEDLFTLPELATLEELLKRVPKCKEKLRTICATMQDTTKRAKAAEATALRLHTTMSERMLAEEGRMHADRQTDLSLKALPAPAPVVQVAPAQDAINSSFVGKSSVDVDAAAADVVNPSTSRSNVTQPPRILRRKLKSRVVDLT